MDVSKFIFCPPVSLDESIGMVVAKNVVAALDAYVGSQVGFVEIDEIRGLSVAVFSDEFDRSDVEGVSSSGWSVRFALKDLLASDISASSSDESQELVEQLELLVAEIKKIKKRIHGG